MNRSKTFRGHRRHVQPCYCRRCESGKFDDYLDKKQQPTKEERLEMKNYDTKLFTDMRTMLM